MLLLSFCLKAFLMAFIFIPRPKVYLSGPLKDCTYSLFSDVIGKLLSAELRLA